MTHGVKSRRNRVRPIPCAVDPSPVVVTKLDAPRSLTGFVRRPRLVERLDDGTVGRLTLVCAPAGYGKTALVADWIELQRHESAWLKLDAADNEPVRFWRHMLAALERARPGLAARVEPPVAPTPMALDRVVTTVVNELATAADGREPGALFLVLDDYQSIETEMIHTSLMSFLTHAPPGVHVTITSRADPPLPLARMRACGQLTEVRTAELRFTTSEAAALLRQITGCRLIDQDVETLTTRAEGWATGLRLVGLSLQDRANVPGLVATFSGGHRYVSDYLSEEVLESQSEQVRAFLLQTSALEELSGPLCDAVTGRNDSQQMLESIERANLFVIPLDEARGRWRYHPLFSDLLRTRLQREASARVDPLPTAAAGPGRAVIPLTARELEMLSAIAEGKKNKEIAGEFYLALDTVKHHVTRILGKLDSSNRTEAVTRARQLGLLP